MSVEKKLLMFRHLVACGFKKIEVHFPSSSETDFTFVRMLIANDEIPDDVWIQVMMPAREPLIVRTFESIHEAKRVLLHLYSASPADIFREFVFQSTHEAVLKMAVEHASLTRRMAGKYTESHGTTFRFMYGVEGFSQANLDFTIELCSGVRDAWFAEGRLNEHPVVINVASTVECAPANHFADQIEYFSRHLPRRDEFILGVHTHNDRAVAATEHAMLAGAQRVEGCLFGNGERTGNVDLITLALNLYTQGISPGPDLSRLRETIDIATYCTEMPIHPRHPYTGSLVYTAFSGSHQNGIRKGLRARGGKGVWRVPYLPMDPTHIGFKYEARINSQSGRSGFAYIVEQQLGLTLPRAVQTRFAEMIQTHCDKEGRELTAEEMVTFFMKAFHYVDPRYPSLEPSRALLDQVGDDSELADALKVQIIFDKKTNVLRVPRNDIYTGMMDALNRVLHTSFKVLSSESFSLPFFESAFVQVSASGLEGTTWWGIGRGSSVTEAKIQALISSVNSAKLDLKPLVPHFSFLSRPGTPASAY